MSLAVRISNIKKGLTPPIIYNSLLSENGIFGWKIVGFWDVWIVASSHLSSICIFFLKISQMASFKIHIGLSFAP